MKKEIILISCGGTGGHIFPAIEIAKALAKKNKKINILFVGAKGKMEMTKVPKEGFPIIGLWMQAFYRKSLFKNILLPIKLLFSLIHSFFILIYYRPLAVIGTGGFATGPLLLVAALLGFKTYIQEQNCFPGITNRLLSKVVSKVFVANDNMSAFFSKRKIENFGNPVRRDLKIKRDIYSLNKSRMFFGLSTNKFTILIIGGSLGANPINSVILDNLDKIRKLDIQLIWQTGEANYNDYLDFKSKFCAIKKFIYRMDLAYNAADLIISRAGAIAITEICYLSKASILIPSPYVTDNHQTKNASYLLDNNACLMIKESDFKRDLFVTLKEIRDNNVLEKMGRNAHQLFNYNAADNIANMILININNKC